MKRALSLFSIILGVIALLGPTSFAAPTLSESAVTNVKDGKATLHSIFTADGQAGTVYFEYGKTIAYGSNTTSVAVTSTDAARAVEATLERLAGNTIYHQRFVFTDGTTTTTTADSTFFTTNKSPVLRADSVMIRTVESVTIAVLANDSDPDGVLLKLSAVSRPSAGVATIVGKQVVYSPSATFAGLDSFSYTAVDGFGSAATATVTVRAPFVGGAGEHGALVKDESGAVVGYLALDVLQSGAFSGKLKIGKSSYGLFGAFDSAGIFVGNAVSGAQLIPIRLEIELGSASNTIKATFGGGMWTATVEVARISEERRVVIAGRYTVDLPPGSSATRGTDTTTGVAVSATSTLPQGHGWMTVKVRESGKAKVRGRMGDGREFSATAFVGGTSSAPVMPIFVTRHGSTLSGTLNLGDTISGSAEWTRKSSSSKYFPDGFDTSITASGSRYEPPEKNQRSLQRKNIEAARASITASGGDVTGFTHEVRVSENDKFQVLDTDLDAVSVKVDRKTGYFSGRFHSGSDRRERTKFNGVLLQSQSAGHGIFLGHELSGSIEIATTVETTPVRPTTPTVPSGTVPLPDSTDSSFDGTDFNSTDFIGTDFNSGNF